MVSIDLLKAYRDKVRREVIKEFREKFCQWTDEEVEREVRRRMESAHK